MFKIPQPIPGALYKISVLPGTLHRRQRPRPILIFIRERRMRRTSLFIFALYLWRALLSDPLAMAGQATTDKLAYYSIHVASFKQLKNANAFVNSLQSQGKIVFWKGTQVGAQGYFYRIFTGRYHSYAAAEKAWQQMKTKGQVSYKGIFSFREVLSDMQIQGTEGALPMPSKMTAGSAHPTPTSQATGRFVDNRDGTVTDRQSGLMWNQNGWPRDFFSAVTWENAIEKCRQFRAGGYSDWTLPTRGQWQSLLDTKWQAPAIVEPNPFRNIIIHMPYWAKDGPLRLFSRRYTTLLYTGHINHQPKTEMAFVWPVRVIK